MIMIKTSINMTPVKFLFQREFHLKIKLTTKILLIIIKVAKIQVHSKKMSYKIAEAVTKLLANIILLKQKFP